VASRVFLNYRRGDTSGHTGRLYDALSAHFGADKVFIDVDNIAIGQDFADRIGEVLSKVDIVLVVIGMEWLDAHTSDGHRRLDDPGDFVRIEVETALRRGILVIPVLVEGTEMPAAASLPDPLKPLARRNACVIDDRDWKRGVDRLVHAIDDVIATGHFPAIPDSTVQTKDAPEVVDVRPDRSATESRWPSLKMHRRAVAAVAGIAVLLSAAALWVATWSGGGDAASSSDVATLIGTIKASVSEHAPGAPFEVEDDCTRWKKGQRPPTWTVNAVRLSFPTRTCTTGDQTMPNDFNTANVFQVAVAKDGRADAAWADVAGNYQSQPGADGIYASADGSCTGAKTYAAMVYMVWWIKGCDSVPFASDPQWQAMDAALKEAVASGTG
jgi:hypothetical protein